MRPRLGSLQVGPELGYELRHGAWALRPMLGIGYLVQLGADEYGYAFETLYVSPGLGAYWLPGARIGVEVRPVFALGKQAQDGLALLAHAALRF